MGWIVLQYRGVQENKIAIHLCVLWLEGLEGELYSKTTKSIATKGCWKSMLQVEIVLQYNYCIAT